VQHLLRTAAYIVMLALAAAVSVPWWAPTELIRDYLADELSRRCEAAVRIDDVSLDWVRGFVIEGLTVSPGDAERPACRVERLAVDMNPLTLLGEGRPAWVELDGAQLNVELADDGTHNLAWLERLMGQSSGGPAPPRISLRQSRITLTLPSRNDSLELAVLDAQIAIASDRSADISVSASLEQDAGAVPISVALRTDAERRPTRVEVTFGGLDLAGAGNEELAALYPYGLTGGRAAGKVTADLDEKGAVRKVTGKLALTDLVDRHGPLADRVVAELGFRTEGDDDAKLTAELTAPGATASAHVAFTAGLADLIELARAGKPVTVESWPHLRSATTGKLLVKVTDSDLPHLFCPVLADEWDRADSHQRGAELNLELRPKGEVHVETANIHLGRAGHVAVGCLIYDVTALAKELKAIRHKPPAEQFRAALGHVALNVGATINDVQAAGRLAPALAEWLTDLPTNGARVVVDLQHAGGLLADGTAPQHTEVHVEADLPNHGKTDVKADVSDLQAAWSAGLRAIDEPTRGNALACLKLFKVAGDLHVRSLALAERFGPEATAALENVKLNGRTLTGSFNVNENGAMGLTAKVEIPAGVEMAFGAEFVKPRDERATVTLAGTITDQTTLSNISAGMTLGRKAGVTVTGGLVKLTGGESAGEQVHVSASGQVLFSDVGNLAACLPRTLERIGEKFPSGDVSGRFAVALMGVDVEWADLTVDLRGLAVDIETFTKPAGERADVTLALGPAGRAGAKYRLDVTADCDYAIFNAEAFLAGLEPDQIARRGEAAARGTVYDAAKLAGRCAALSNALRGTNLAGACTFGGNGGWDGDLAAGYVQIDATDMAIVTAEGQTRRVKPAGTVAEIDLFASIVRDRDDVTLQGLAVSGRVGASTFAVEADGQLLLQSGIDSWHDVLRQWDIAAKVSARIDTPLLDLLPELGPHVKRYGLKGSVDISVDSTGDEEDLALGFDVDAGGLSGQVDLADLADALGIEGDHAKRLASMGRILKGADQPARAWLALILPSDPSHVLVDELEASVGKTRLAAAGRVELDRANSSRAGIAIDGKFHLVDAGELATFMPALKPYRPAGSARASFAYRRSGADDAGTLDTGITLAKLAARYREKDIQLDGRVDFVGAALTADGMPSVRRVHTAGLDIRAAGSGATVLADISDPTGAATGSIRLLAKTIDAVAIEKWLTGKLATWPEGELTPEGKAALLAQADATIAELTSIAADMDVELHARIDSLRAYDPFVEEIYDLDQVRFDASVRAGRVRARYAAALNGGIVEGRLAVALDGKTPIVSSRRQVRNVIATDNMAPQMHVFFPGNTPKGTFSRVEDLREPLRDLLASQIDPRMPVPAAGSAETITTDGALEATAATGVMAWLFPALKNTEYRYRKMTAFSTFDDDGTASNDMIFDGKDYGLYMTGTTDQGGLADYEVGMLALGSLQSHRWQHKYRQGRLPLFRFRGRLYRREFTNITVDYYWPHKSLGKVLFENNILYRLMKD